MFWLACWRLIFSTTPNRSLSPILAHLRGWIEVVPQAMLLSALLCYWANHSGHRWLNWLPGVIFFVLVALPVLGLLATGR